MTTGRGIDPVATIVRPLRPGEVCRLWLARAGLERAVVLGITARLWSLIAGPITALLIASMFDPVLQGYHLTFTSLLSLQAFVELGLTQVIVQFASHEWSRLRIGEDGEVTGEPEALARLVSVARFALNWFGAAALVLAIGLATAGALFFNSAGHDGIAWLSPWLLLCVAQALLLALVPFWSVMEGCNQVEEVYRYRLGHAVVTVLSLWAAIAGGLKLWAAAVSSLAAVIWSVAYLIRRCRPVLRVFAQHAAPGALHWRREIWPLQWRYALSWFGGYLAFSAFTPVIFRLEGAVVAGQMGMTLSLAAALHAVSSTWVNVKVPRFGVLVAVRDFDALDRLAIRTAAASFCVAASGALTIEGGLLLLTRAHHPLATRILSPVDTGLFLLATVLLQLSVAQSTYLRAHKREPLVGVSLLGGLLVVGSTVVLGRLHGTTGVAAGYLGVVSIVMVGLVTIICNRCRREWHTEDSAGL
jgi:hypothetical protein